MLFLVDKLTSVYERKLPLSVACSISSFHFLYKKNIYLNDMMKTGIKLGIKCKKALVNSVKKFGVMCMYYV